MGPIRFHRRAVLSSAVKLAAAGLSWGLCKSGALGGEAWPAPAITVIVPFPPGGQAELAAVPVAAELHRHLAVDVDIDYRTGDAGAIGNAVAAHSDPGGGTLLVTLTSVVTLPESHRLLGVQVPYEMAQLRPIARILSDPLMLAVRADAPWSDAAGFIADARARPQAIVFGSNGAFGTQHVAMGMLEAVAELKLRHQPFQGAGPALKALLKGEVMAVPAAPGLLLKHVKAGELRVLASWGAGRKAPFSDVPTLAELGFRGAEYYTWAGLFAPAGMPIGLVRHLRFEVRQAVHDSQLANIFERAGSPMAYLDAPEFEVFVASESARLLPVVRQMILASGHEQAKIEAP